VGPPFPLVRRTFETLASLLAPDVCAGCDARIGILRVFCAVCAGTLVPAPPPGQAFDRETAAFTYGGALASAITSLKYGGRVDRARPLAHVLIRAIALEPVRLHGAHGTREELPPSVVVPVPLHRTRLAERGFNHAALLAAPVARHLGARFAPVALARTRDTPAQATLGRSARLQNVARAFTVRAGERPLDGERVLLVDDVRTTGATLRACALALRDAGAASVETLVLAISSE
jgi:ComF family protein